MILVAAKLEKASQVSQANQFGHVNKHWANERPFLRRKLGVVMKTHTWAFSPTSTCTNTQESTHQRERYSAAGKKAGELGALAALPVDSGSISHGSSQSSTTTVPGIHWNALVWSLLASNSCVIHSLTYRQISIHLNFLKTNKLKDWKFTLVTIRLLLQLYLPQDMLQTITIEYFLFKFQANLWSRK